MHSEPTGLYLERLFDFSCWWFLKIALVGLSVLYISIILSLGNICIPIVMSRQPYRVTSGKNIINVHYSSSSSSSSSSSGSSISSSTTE